MSAINDRMTEISDFFEKTSQGNVHALPQFSSDSLSTLYAMAYELYRNGKYEDAKGFFRFLTLVDSFERKYWMGLAACYQMLKGYAEAIECYSAAAIQDPSDPYVHWHAADCFFHSGNLTDANQALDSALTTAKANESYAALIPKLSLISDAWSNLPNGASHA